MGRSITDPAPAFDPAYPDRNIRTDYIYDNNGNQIGSVTHGRTSRTYYDGLNRPVSAVQNLTGQDVSASSAPAFDPAYPDQNVRIDYFYDGAGNQIAVKQWTAADGSGIYTRTYSDALNRPVTVVRNFVSANLTDAAPAYEPANPDRNIRTDYTYDANGNQIASKLWRAADGSGLITRTYYDAFNRPVTTVQNLVGQTIETPAPPVFDPAYPDRNVRVDSYYDAGGKTIATRRWADAAGNGPLARMYFDAIDPRRGVIRRDCRSRQGCQTVQAG